MLRTRTTKTLLRASALLLGALVPSLLAAVSSGLHAQAPGPSNPLASLKTVPVPEPPNLGEFVRDRQAALRLGKALFWDMQVGSDGVTACASCHYGAGADTRTRNQISPGLLRVAPDGAPNPDNTFTLGGPNRYLKESDFPFHRLKDVNNRNGSVLADSNDVASSQGVFLYRFQDIVPGSDVDAATWVQDLVFQVGGVNVRRVAPRNTPSVINAVFNHRNFWDGRAQNDFNGVNPFGSRDPDARVLAADGRGNVGLVQVRLPNASLASQAVGPPLSHFEMSAEGRTFTDIGRKLGSKTGKKVLALPPLGKQLIARDDSVLGGVSRYPSPGLLQTYRQMIQASFHPKWWNSPMVVRIEADGGLTFLSRPDGPQGTDEYGIDEFNFSLFFGIAVQMYEATLVANDTPVDRYLEGNTGALTAAQKRGLALFQGKANCVSCHGGPEMTNASVRNVVNQRLERMLLGDNKSAVYDNGFYNIGVRPTAEDLGLGAADPWGNPLSDTRLAQRGLFTDPNLTPAVAPNERTAVDGAFKTPGLRNVALTAPYFHNGGQLTLMQVVEFYNRGGDRRGPDGNDTTGFGPNGSNLDTDVRSLGLTATEKADLVAFLEALTDERVRYRRAPFDHPQLFVPNGHPWDPGNPSVVLRDAWTGNARDQFVEVPAVGQSGGALLSTFRENLNRSR